MKKCVGFDFENISVDTVFYICKCCLNILRENRLPSVCILNNLHEQEVPQELLNLNDYEKILIQRAKAFQVLQKVRPVSNKHLPYKQSL